MDSPILEAKKYINDVLLDVIKSVGEKLEGNVFMAHETLEYNQAYYTKQTNIVKIASQSHIKQVLEIGFNSGFSALLMLLSNPNLSITCVDKGYHRYVVPCFNKLKETFGDRIVLKLGDSNVVLPTITEKYDLIHIDGCHYINVAEKDIQNSLKLSHQIGTQILMDDTDYGPLKELWWKYVDLFDWSHPNIALDDSIYHDLRQITMTVSVKMTYSASNLAIYSTFCGQNNNSGYIVTPAYNEYPCYYYSNNFEILQHAKSQGWIPIFMPEYFPPSNDSIVSATQAKFAKAVPNLLKELNDYRYLCYLDSKVLLDPTSIPKAIQFMTDNQASLIIREHPFLGPDVWNEFHASLWQTRYCLQQHQMRAYIEKHLAIGKVQAKADHHYWTSLIIRDMTHPEIKKINEMWYQHIQECGIECQISFFFIAQMFKSIKPYNHIGYPIGYTGDKSDNNSGNKTN